MSLPSCPECGSRIITQKACHSCGKNFHASSGGGGGGGSSKGGAPSPHPNYNISKVPPGSVKIVDHPERPKYGLRNPDSVMIQPATEVSYNGKSFKLTDDRFNYDGTTFTRWMTSNRAEALLSNASGTYHLTKKG